MHTNIQSTCSTCPSGKSGGSLGEFGPGQMVKEFNDVVFTTGKVGKVRTLHARPLVSVPVRVGTYLAGCTGARK